MTGHPTRPGLDADDADPAGEERAKGAGEGGEQVRPGREEPDHSEPDWWDREEPEQSGLDDPELVGEPPSLALARVEAAISLRQPHRMVPDLDRIAALTDLLGSPQKAYPAIHITGTNGKTTTARMVDALLRAFGLRTGRYTSPHLQSVTERICVDGEPLPAERFAAAYDDVAPFAALVDTRSAEPVTFFELQTAMAFAAFADTPVDVAVVEVGLGGSWDATNVLHAGTVVVTAVAVDHAELLGATPGEIAAEKAGIAHEGAVVVSAAQPPDAAAALAERAEQVGATVLREGADFGVAARRLAHGGQELVLRGLGGSYDGIFLPLYGEHMAANAVLALAAVETFLGGGRGRLDVDAVREGFAAVTSPGRLERVRTAPTVLLDAAHNPAGALALAAAVAEAFTVTRFVGVVAVLADKDAAGILAALEPVLAEVVVTTTTSARALPVEDLAVLARAAFGPGRVTTAARLADALGLALQRVQDSGGAEPALDAVLVTGSVVTVGEARTLLVQPVLAPPGEG